MKFLLLAALLTLAPPQVPQDTVNIDGRILRVGSQEPIPNVQVTLIKSSAGTTRLTPETVAALDTLQQIVSSAPRGISHAYLDSVIATREQALGLAPGTFAQSTTGQATVLTDSAGRFSFKNYTPGTYGVRAALDGYFGPSINGAASTTVTKSVTVEATKPATPTDIFMVKGGTITGRVRDPNGQPVSGVDVGAMRLTYSNGRPQWTPAVSKPTNDRGEFRVFWVSPGTYYVGITPRDSSARTFFPGVTEPTAATPLVVRDGAEIGGIDFSIQAIASAPTYAISGTATNPLAVPNPTTGVLDRNVNTFILSPRELGPLDSVNGATVQNSLPPQARPNGEFEIRNVRPGSYELFIYYLTGAPPLQRDYIDRARVEIRDSDVEGLTLQIQKGTEIRGKVVPQGTTALPASLRDKIRINLHSQETMPDAFAIIVGGIPVDAAGDFSAPDIPSARYSLQVTGLPETAYVADIRQVGNTVFNTGFTVGSQPAIPLEIVVNANGGTIEGNIGNVGNGQTADRKPRANTTVVLVPPAADRQNPMKYKSVQTDEKGNFSVKGVPPGEYTLFAWESVPPTAWMNSDFLAKYQNSGRRVLVTEGTRMSVQLDQIPDDTQRR